jgi:hypothetical protein
VHRVQSVHKEQLEPKVLKVQQHFGTLLVLMVLELHTQSAMLQHTQDRLGTASTLTVATLETLLQKELTGH